MKVLDRIMKLGGFWIHDAYGGPYTVRERYSEQQPEEAMFVSLEEIEKEYGKIIAVKEYTDDEDKNSQLVIWTDRNVLIVYNYDGREYILALPRNPPEDAEFVDR